MSARVDPTTKLCCAHNALGCADCMLADFRDALAAALVATLKRKPKTDETVDERFDLGGEA